MKLNHRGERCTFEAILEDHKLTDPVLHRLALIVRGADVKGQEHVSPESLGLRAIVHGFALGISDEERLAREFPIYDRYTSTFASNRIKPIGFGFPAVKQEEVITMFRSMKKRRLLLLASASLTVPDMSVLAQDTPSDYRTF